ncbi:DUF6624 domain-containing protein [Oleiagrimonas sp.]|jgi:hypothetical protein|uniref:DUF6624 domain-containing protein n=1 Tax=Oleiagrimonas sp. TaxID=2010330 RepID=UPI002617C3D6|nr:DUF6624 domain-containing protein [Oleiagrimonas sp.]MDA3914879.1 hypothetical protein [Oleiagrimonas sp.]
MFTDRVRLAQHKKQIYGNQITVQDGNYVLRPIEGPLTGLDQCRARMDLMLVREYLCVIRATYGSPSKKR